MLPASECTDERAHSIREKALEFAKDVCATAGWIRPHPGENLLPPSGERIFAGPSPVQNTCTFLLIIGKLFCFASL